MAECEGLLYPKDGESASFWHNVGYAVSVGFCDQCGHLIHKTGITLGWVHSATDEHESDKRPEPDPTIDPHIKMLCEQIDKLAAMWHKLTEASRG